MRISERVEKLTKCSHDDRRFRHRAECLKQVPLVENYAPCERCRLILDLRADEGRLMAAGPTLHARVRQTMADMQKLLAAVEAGDTETATAIVLHVAGACEADLALAEGRET